MWISPDVAGPSVTVAPRSCSRKTSARRSACALPRGREKRREVDPRSRPQGRLNLRPPEVRRVKGGQALSRMPRVLLLQVPLCRRRGSRPLVRIIPDDAALGASPVDVLATGERPLRPDVKVPEGLDLVAEELEAHRMAELRQPDVQDAPPPAVLARLLDL